MHHRLPDRKRALSLLLRGASGSGKVGVLSQIEPQTPRLVVSFRQCLQVSVLRPYSPQSPEPRGFPGEASAPASAAAPFRARSKTVSNRRPSPRFRP